ncbi:MAG: hypothetical protein DI535_04710 [Citrobacter freundii]|nr:MAG: hypothetical protein DI535_04710 [Citrobacter freundii]
MRKHFFLFLFITSFSFILTKAEAQKDYKPGILLMLQYSDTDFKSILGSKLSEEPDIESANYAPTEKIGIGSEKIVRSNNSDMSFYTCTLSLVDASKLINDVLELANDYVKKGIFTGEDLTDGKGKTVTVIKNKEGHEIMKIISRYVKDDSDENNYFAIVIYGKSLRTKMAE